VKCPYCGAIRSRVIDSRKTEGGVSRRRECAACQGRFGTFERAVLAVPMVVKRDGRREVFDRDKLRQGIRKACACRPVSTEQIQWLAERVEARTLRRRKAEISSRTIGDLVMQELREVDELAYVLFASVYLPLTDLESVRAEVERLLDRRTQP
jgi:transcriptional repressor NrdR